MLALLGLVAVAAPVDLAIDVVAADKPAPLRAKGEPPPTIPIGTLASLHVDGVHEPAWNDVDVAPPLRSFATGWTPPTVPIKVALTDTGLALAIAPYEGELTLVLSPTGYIRDYVVVEVGGGAKRCVGDGEQWFVPPIAAPCRPYAVKQAEGADGREVLVPLKPLKANQRMRLLATLNHKWGGGTWHPQGSRSLDPRGGLPFALPVRRARLFVQPDLDNDVLQATLATDAQGAGPWQWTLHSMGRVVRTGRIEAKEGRTRFSIPAEELLEAQVSIRQIDDSLVGAGVVARVPPLHRRAKLASVVFEDTLEIRTLLTDAQPDAVVEIAALDGTVLGRGTAELPAGTAVVHVDAAGIEADSVVVRIVGLLDDRVAVRSP